MAHMNTYKFIHEFEDEFEVTMTTHADTLDDIMEEFAAFLRGCQFAEISIKSAFESVAKEIHVDKDDF